jgi:chemotaxis protein methyltransferase CheR
MTRMPSKDIERIETEILLEGIFRRWGYDFRHYAHASLKRRLKYRLGQSGLNHLSEMLPELLHNEEFFNLLLKDLSVTVTEMFRDPRFYATLRKQVIPVLRTYPFIKIWHAGCATGEEVYSMAILLKEEGLYDRAQLYATDYNNQSLEIARRGNVPAR